jgi:hypothetical protein
MPSIGGAENAACFSYARRKFESICCEVGRFVRNGRVCLSSIAIRPSLFLESSARASPELDMARLTKGPTNGRPWLKRRSRREPPPLPYE